MTTTTDELLKEMKLLREQVRNMRAQQLNHIAEVNYHCGLTLCSYARLDLLEEKVAALEALNPQKSLPLKNEWKPKFTPQKGKDIQL